MDLNLNALKDIDFICELARGYYDRRTGSAWEIEWLGRISHYQQMVQAEIKMIEEDQNAARKS